MEQIDLLGAQESPDEHVLYPGLHKWVVAVYVDNNGVVNHLKVLRKS